jgi:predicted TIM-barrel fold metal-dependent hydrolase
MPYVDGPKIYDADSHIFESPDFYAAFAEPAVRERMGFLYSASDGFEAYGVAAYEAALALQDDPDYRSRDAEEVMQRKLWDAQGAFRKEDRSGALDHLGFASQIVYDSFLRLQLRELEQGTDMELLYGLARAHVRAMVDFCAGDDRLLAAGYVPMADPERAVAQMRFALDEGCPVVTMAVDCPREHSPSHKDLEPMWAMAAEARVPIIFHLGGGRKPTEAFTNTGRSLDPGFVGGDGTFTSHEYLCAPLPVIETLSALIVDGVLDRHPNLRLGLVEYGATWVPGYMRFLDSAMAAYKRTEGRLEALSLKLSEYVTRQVRVAPYHFEDTGWLIREGGPEIALFSSDYPHKEGGRDPIKRFEASLDDADIPEPDRVRFYSENFADLMGWTS